MTVIRWLLVLPAAALGFAIAQLVTILVTAFLPDVVSQLASSASTPIGFILLGARVAPRWKVRVAGILAVLMFLLHGMYLGWLLLGLVKNYSSLVAWLSLPLAIVASIVGIYIVFNKERRHGYWR
jgi:hypothetical protein